MEKLQSFRDCEELDSLVQGVTEAQKAIRRTVVEAAAEMPSPAAALVLCELSCRLFAANCDAARVRLPMKQRAVASHDADTLFRMLRELCDDDLVVDLETLERIHAPEGV